MALALAIAAVALVTTSKPTPAVRWWRPVALCTCAAAMILTDVRTFAVAIAMGGYLALRWRTGAAARWNLAAVAAGAVVAFAVVGAPSLFSGPRAGDVTGDPAAVRRFAELPMRFFTEAAIKPEGVGLLAAAFYVVPLLFARRRPELLLWWMWLAAVAVWGLIDDARDGPAVTLTANRALAASPAVYALAAAMLADQRGWRAAAVPLICAASCAMALEQAYVRRQPDFRGTLAFVARHVQPDDAVVFYSRPDASAAKLLALYFDHHTGARPRGVVILTGPAPDDVRAQLAKAGTVWVISDALSFDERALLGDGARVTDDETYPGIALIRRIELPKTR